jgi:copper transport protein
MKSRRSLILLGVLILWMWGGRAAHAHANLLRSEPAANAVLTAAPAEIRLWFSEPLEPRFSHIHLFDAAGRRIEMLDSAVDAGDAFQMFLTLPPLADGVYTVAWANVSTADGHPSEGSFPFTIGEGTAAANITHDTSERLPIEAALVRSFYIYSLALFIGGVGFWLLVWCSALPNGDAAIEKRLMALIGLAWLLTGLANVLHLFLQTSLASGTTLIAAITSPSLLNVLSATRYGSLWWVRAGLWLTAGIVLYFTRASAEAYRRALLWGVLVLSTGIAFTYSLFSHADSTASALVDWLHLLATGLWVGGLAQFINALLALRQSHDTTQVVSALTAWFSNLARAAVFTLVITGMYSAWLHVGC